MLRNKKLSSLIRTTTKIIIIIYASGDKRVSHSLDGKWTLVLQLVLRLTSMLFKTADTIYTNHTQVQMFIHATII